MTQKQTLLEYLLLITEKIIIFTSTLRPRVNELSVPLTAALTMTIAMSNPCRAETERLSSAPTPQEIHQANIRLPKIISGQPDLLEDATVVTKLEKKLSWSSHTSGARLLLPVSVRYHGTANSYCRLATASRGVKNIVLVKLPTQANFDDCNEVSELKYMEINGDGMLDLVEGILVKSNVSLSQIVTPIVYLSTPTPESGYCYSDAASRQLIPADLKSEENIRNALEKAKRRLGVTVFDCAPLDTSN
jgi:hypothetical protein